MLRLFLFLFLAGWRLEINAVAEVLMADTQCGAVMGWGGRFLLCIPSSADFFTQRSSAQLGVGYSQEKGLKGAHKEEREQFWT